MATATPLYGTPTAMTITLASLATQSSDSGRASTVLDVKDSLDCIDLVMGGKLTVGTTPTINRMLEAWSYASYDDVEYTGGASMDGTDKDVTPASKSEMKCLQTVLVPVTTSNVAYKWCSGVAAAYGGVLPVQVGLFITHNTAVNLNSTAGNHEAHYTTIKYESA